MKRSAKGLIPTSIVGLVLLASWLAPARVSNYNLASVCSYGYLGAPTVTGIAPTSGPLAGGTSVVITGCGFTGTTSVHFGAASASFTFNSDSQVTATSPAHAAGVVDVTVTTAAGTSATVAADQFTYSTACMTANVVPDKASPQNVGTTVTFTASSTNCPTPQYRFWIQAPGQGWVMVRDYGVATFVWNTTGLAIGTYTIDVWARNTGSAASYEAFAVISYTLQTAPPGCSTAQLFSDQSGNPQSGTLIVFTASSTGCPSPQYKFWIQASGGGWNVGQDWDGSQWTWNSAGASGTYNIDVWARNTGSGATYEAFALISITFDPAVKCTDGGITSDKASPQQSGTIVTFTATSFSCQQPQLRWWVQAPGGAWVIVKDWTTNSPSNFQGTYVWNTAGLAAGTYKIDVWARYNGEPGTSPDYGSVVSYTLTIAVACATPNVTPDKASPQAHGTLVTFTATSTLCSQPLYRYWVQAPGGGWVIVQEYSTTATYAWNTTGLAPGVYHIDVWVKQNGSAAAEEAAVVIAYTIT